MGLRQSCLESKRIPSVNRFGGVRRPAPNRPSTSLTESPSCPSPPTKPVRLSEPIPTRSTDSPRVPEVRLAQTLPVLRHAAVVRSDTASGNRGRRQLRGHEFRGCGKSFWQFNQPQGARRGSGVPPERQPGASAYRLIPPENLATLNSESATFMVLAAARRR